MKGKNHLTLIKCTFVNLTKKFNNDGEGWPFVRDKVYLNH